METRSDADQFKHLLVKLKDPDLVYAELVQRKIENQSIQELTQNLANVTRIFDTNIESEKVKKKFSTRTKKDRTALKRLLNKHFSKEFRGNIHILLTENNVEKMLTIIHQIIDKRLNSSYFQAVFNSIENETDKQNLIRAVGVSLANNLSVTLYSNQGDPDKYNNKKRFFNFYLEVTKLRSFEAPIISETLFKKYKSKLETDLKQSIGWTIQLSDAKPYEITPNLIRFIPTLIETIVENYEKITNLGSTFTNSLFLFGDQQQEIFKKAGIEVLADILIAGKKSDSEEKYNAIKASYVKNLPSHIYKAVKNKFHKKNASTSPSLFSQSKKGSKEETKEKEVKETVSSYKVKK